MILDFQTLSTIINRSVLYQQLVDNTDGLINSWFISKNPYQQSIVDNKLIFDKIVRINKEDW
jgi:hypothetical protein